MRPADRTTILLLLQSMAFLPLLVFFTKGTTVMLVFTLIAGAIYARSIPALRSTYIGWVSLLFFAGVVSALWSIAPTVSLERSAKLAMFLAALALLIHIVDRWTDEDRRRIAAMAIWGWCIALAALCVIALFGDAIASALGGAFPSLKEKNRLYNIENLPNNGAVILVLTAFPVLRGILQRQNGKLIAVGLTLVLFLMIFRSGSASALLGLCLGLVLWGACVVFPKVFKRCFGPSLFAVLLLMPLLLTPLTNNIESLVRNVPNFPNSFTHRILIWDFTIDRIAEKPLFGWGLETSRTIPGGDEKRKINYAVPWADKPLIIWDENLPLHPHNGALQVWLELGLFGMLVVVALLRKIVRTQVVDRSVQAAGPMAGFLGAVIAVYCVAFGLMQSWWIAIMFLGWAALRAMEYGDLPAEADR